MNSYFAREYRPEDWPMVYEWWLSHETDRGIIEKLLPPVGIVIEQDGIPSGAIWCHLSAGIGVAFLEFPVTRPGLTMGEASRVMHCALDAVEEVCKTHGYGLIYAFAVETMARWLETRKGFIRAGERVQLMKPVLT